MVEPQRRVLVTGGARGIGRAICEAFVREGAHVTIADRDPTVLEVANATGPSLATGVVADVTQLPSVLELLRDAAGSEEVLDVVVNNVGWATETSFEDIDEDEWGAQLAATLNSAVFVCQAALPYLRRSTLGPNVVNIGSINGMGAYGHEAYSAAKAGLVSFTQNFALRYGRENIRANLVAPGTVVTSAWESRVEADAALLDRLKDHVPLGRLGRPEDVASTCVFLASAQAAWVTGVVLPVDGGLTCGNLAFLGSRLGQAK